MLKHDLLERYFDRILRFETSLDQFPRPFCDVLLR